jgi:hypothetical protein
LGYICIFVAHVRINESQLGFNTTWDRALHVWLGASLSLSPSLPASLSLSLINTRTLSLSVSLALALLLSSDTHIRWGHAGYIALTWLCLQVAAGILKVIPAHDRPEWFVAALKLHGTSGK